MRRDEIALRRVIVREIVDMLGNIIAAQTRQPFVRELQIVIARVRFGDHDDEIVLLGKIKLDVEIVGVMIQQQNAGERTKDESDGDAERDERECETIR